MAELLRVRFVYMDSKRHDCRDHHLVQLRIESIETCINSLLVLGLNKIVCKGKCIGNVYDSRILSVVCCYNIEKIWEGRLCCYSRLNVTLYSCT